MMDLSNKNYDRLKFVSMVVLPALAALYLGLGQAWEWPETDKVVTTIVLLDTFLGTVLQIKSAGYNASYDGYLTAEGVNPDTGIPNLKMVVTTHPDELVAGKEARLKIGTPPEH